MVAKEKRKALVVAVDMGYGHQRAAHALRHLCKDGRVVSANAYPGIPPEDETLWKSTRRLYDFISRLKGAPLIGEPLFALFDSIQSIPPFYPRKMRTRPTLQLKQIYGFFERRGWGKHLINKLQSQLPFVATFFVPAFMAEAFKYEGSVFCVVTDTDVSRSWAPLRPSRTAITYLTPTERASERLSSYGVQKKRIRFTGFPLPDIFSKHDLHRRVTRLDSEGRYAAAFAPLIAKHLALERVRAGAVSITFAVGGAGAQQDIGEGLLSAFAKDIKKGRVRLNLVAGTHEDARDVFSKAALRAGCTKDVKILYAKTKDAYFGRFNTLMKTTDVLWTKPSELVFFAALGIPLVLTPPIGSQEKANRRWVKEKGFGIDQPDMKVVREWFWDVVTKGLLAEAAMEGYLEGERKGAENIAKVVFGR